MVSVSNENNKILLTKKSFPVKPENNQFFAGDDVTLVSTVTGVDTILIPEGTPCTFVGFTSGAAKFSFNPKSNSFLVYGPGKQDTVPYHVWILKNEKGDAVEYENSVFELISGGGSMFYAPKGSTKVEPGSVLEKKKN